MITQKEPFHEPWLKLMNWWKASVLIVRSSSSIQLWGSAVALIECVRLLPLPCKHALFDLGQCRFTLSPGRQTNSAVTHHAAMESSFKLTCSLLFSQASSIHFHPHSQFNSDRTENVSYCRLCYGDILYKFERLIFFKKQII